MDHQNDLQGKGFPLTAEQLGLLERASPALHLRVQLPSGLAPARLLFVLQQLAQRHEILRCRLEQLAGYREPRLCVAAHDITLDVIHHDDAAALAAWGALRFGEPGQALWKAACFVGAQSGELWLCCSPLVADRLTLASLAAEMPMALDGSLTQAEEPLQFGAYSEWLDELVNGADNAAAQAYWTSQQAGLRQSDAGAALPAYRRNIQVDPTAETGLYLCTLAPSAAAALDATVGHAATALHAVWLALLARLSTPWEIPQEQSEQQGLQARTLTSGWQHDCRHDDELREMLAGAIGRFDKVSPLALEFTADLSFQGLLAQLEERMQAHREVQEYQPVSASQPVIFSWSKMPVANADWRVLALPGPQPGFELALLVQQEPSGWTLAFHFDQQRYRREEIALLATQFQQLLATALAAPQQALSTLPLHAAALDAATIGVVDTPPPGVTVPQSIAACIARHADQPALANADERISYGELGLRVDSLARALIRHGVQPGDVVALQLPRSISLVLALLAVWRCGAAYLPLETDTPAARLHAILQAARVKLLLTQQPDAAYPDGCIGLAWASLDHRRHEDSTIVLPPPALPADVAYVLFTSGSTGTPKGVVIGHEQLAAYVSGVSDALQLGACKNWALTGTVAADLGNTALFGALSNGACLHVADAQDMQDGAHFADFMRRAQIDALKMVPSHLDALLDCETPVLPATLVLGGEATSAALVKRIRALAPECRIFNHYGPTECTVGVLVHRADSADEGGLPLSSALPHAYVRVLDEQRRPCPVGTVGQLWLGGAQVARGYLDPEQGQEVFIDDPWASGHRLYRSGDLALLLPQGGLRLMGRSDHQLKVRGFRIEPGEVEAALLRQAGVRQALVLATHNTTHKMTQDMTLAACVAGEDEGGALARWRAALAETLPAPMQPARWLVLPEFPRLGNGKIDRKSLLAMLDAQATVTALTTATASAMATPTTQAPLPLLLAEQMALLLERPTLAVDDDFFELGAHSLLVIKLVARIRKLLQLELAPALVFDHPSAAALAAAIQATAADRSGLDRLARQQRAASAAQQDPLSAALPMTA